MDWKPADDASSFSSIEYSERHRMTQCEPDLFSPEIHPIVDLIGHD